ncbi:ketoacyl reductase [Planomonospora parontospora subsp. parontospora]|uniref:Ketoacyl reductase n=2 Tax=Planomonospora parontospora TaxID=58119 RepID=A0AA37BD25_9ACTN|nr:SDR family oxidoreductase [Planomonospora parontospora]GGK52078.1 ketoacyl reductase [Planomonospora parontospora]GII06917.1 ketoacyl reductase [Planomonospora parontospora subsp. parontospora]
MKPQNTTALVTGASSGIGAEFARRLAARGHHLVLVARSVPALEALAAELRGAYGVRVEVVPQDLSAPDAATRVAEALAAREITIDLLVNNAGFGTAGRFEGIAAEREHDELMVNVVALVGLTHAFLPGMLARGSGAVVNVGSTAGFNITPYFATYGASKTFVLNFSLALWSEMRGTGVKVLAVAPGPVETAFFDGIGTRKAAIGAKMSTPERVVAAALRALDRDRGYVVPGLGNFAVSHLMPRRPRKLVAMIGRMVTRQVADELTPVTAR